MKGWGAPAHRALLSASFTRPSYRASVLKMACGTAFSLRVGTVGKGTDSTVVSMLGRVVGAGVR